VSKSQGCGGGGGRAKEQKGAADDSGIGQPIGAVGASKGMRGEKNAEEQRRNGGGAQSAVSPAISDKGGGEESEAEEQKKKFAGRATRQLWEGV